jgi:hypothetical protein
VALGQYEDPGRAIRLELVERSSDDREPALIRDPIHARLELGNGRDFHALEVSDEVLHYSSGGVSLYGLKKMARNVKIASISAKRRKAEPNTMFG